MRSFTALLLASLAGACNTYGADLLESDGTDATSGPTSSSSAAAGAGGMGGAGGKLEPTTSVSTTTSSTATSSSTGSNCVPPEVDCGDGTCVPVGALCDGVDDCASGYDEDPAFCTGPPPTWMCNDAFYDAGDGCDCGCGATDPDCASNNVSACQYCNNMGSCSSASCPGTINPTDNKTCS